MAALPKSLPSFAEPQIDRILKIDPVVVYVIWNAINQKVCFYTCLNLCHESDCLTICSAASVGARKVQRTRAILVW